MPTNYRVLVFGEVGAQLPEPVVQAIEKFASHFDLHLGDEIEIVDGSQATNEYVATVAVFLGHSPPPPFTATWVERAGIPIIPIVSDIKQFNSEVPVALRHLNGVSLSSPSAAESIAAAILENLRLLPQQRRVFLSYVRKEATTAALQLFSDLEARQFRVFIDTHGVRPGAKFQPELWHQLCDCDVMVMLDTESYFGRQWTREEFGKANLKKAAILRVAFPGVVAHASLSITDSIDIEPADLVDGRLTADALDRIGDKIESLRSRSVATRNANLIGSIRAAVTQLGGSILSAGAMRRVEMQLPSGKRVLAYPAVGVPNATTLNEVALHAESKPAAIFYDRLGVREEWIDHLRWLGEHVPEVRWIQTFDAAWDLASWDAEP